MLEQRRHRLHRYGSGLRTREPCLMHAWRDDWRLDQLPCWEPGRFAPQVARHLRDPLGAESQCFR